MNWNIRYASEKRDVVTQLEEDYPEDSLDWVKNDAKWSGPEKINPDDVDYSNQSSWLASHEEQKVKKFMKKIKKGKEKPVVLVKTPKNKKFIVIDGHHRALAYKNLGKSLVAWVGEVKKEKGPWDTFHDEQNKVEAVDK